MSAANTTATMTFCEARKQMEAGERVYSLSWPPAKTMRMIQPEEWDGLFPLSCPVIVIEDERGMTVCGSCMDDVLREDYVVFKKP